jgi:hypothetical protein
MQNTSHKSIYSLYKSCSALLQETNKISFTILRFFLEFICILQVAGTSPKKGKNLFAQGPLETFGLHKTALASNSWALESKNPHRGTLGGAERLAGGQGSPELTNKRHRTVIGLTTGPLAEEDWPEASPASGDGKAVAARLRELGFRRR